MREEVYNFPTEYTTKTSISHSSLDPHFTGRCSLSALKPLESKGKLCFSKGLRVLLPQVAKGGRVHQVGWMKTIRPFPTPCPYSAPEAVAVASLCASQSQREC